MSKPRRYVRVRLRWHKGRLQAAWGCVLCHWILCHLPSSQWFDPAYAHQRAGLHAAMCPAVAAAMERDQLRAELDLADGIDKELAKVQDMRNRYRAALEACEAAYAAAQREWEDRKTHFRADLDRALDELDRMRADRNRLRDRLNQINPLNKDNE